jgi:hypothetical protein
LIWNPSLSASPGATAAAVASSSIQAGVVKYSCQGCCCSLGPPGVAYSCRTQKGQVQTACMNQLTAVDWVPGRVGSVHTCAQPCSTALGTWSSAG